LKINKEILDDRQVKLTVEYTTSEFEGYKRRGAKKIAKNVKIPGFRPGKAPYNVIVNHYGEAAIIQEAIDILLEDDYGKILDEQEIKPSGAGNLEKIESSDPPTFVFIVPLEPEVNLGEYKEIRKPYELEEFDIKEVDEFIENLRRNAATIIPANHPAEAGDLVYFNLSGEFLNPEEGEDATITDKTPQQAVIPSDDETPQKEWPYQGFSRELIGVAEGDVKELKHQYEEDDEDEEFRGKTAIFTVEIQSVKSLELPELDDDFAKTQGDFETVADFRKVVEERLREQHKNAYDETYFEELLTEISSKTEILYPPQMLEHEEEHIQEDLKSRLERQNMDFETYLKLRDKDEETFIEEEIRPVAKERLERSLVIDALIESEGLKINQDLLNSNINEIISEIVYSGNAQEMQKHMGKDEFSRAISMEGVSRTMNSQILERLKLIATGQPIPEEGSDSDLKEEAFVEPENDEDSQKDTQKVEEPAAPGESKKELTADKPVQHITEGTETVDQENENIDTTSNDEPDSETLED
jgi:trigger factor